MLIEVLALHPGCATSLGSKPGERRCSEHSPPDIVVGAEEVSCFASVFCLPDGVLDRPDHSHRVQLQLRCKLSWVRVSGSIASSMNGVGGWVFGAGKVQA